MRSNADKAARLAIRWSVQQLIGATRPDDGEPDFVAAMYASRDLLALFVTYYGPELAVARCKAVLERLDATFGCWLCGGKGELPEFVVAERDNNALDAWVHVFGCDDHGAETECPECGGEGREGMGLFGDSIPSAEA